MGAIEGQRRYTQMVQLDVIIFVVVHPRLRVMDSSPFRIQIRRREKPSRPYTWEIRGASETKCVERGSYEYPTRGAAMKATRALLRILVQYSK